MFYKLQQPILFVVLVLASVLTLLLVIRSCYRVCCELTLLADGVTSNGSLCTRWIARCCAFCFLLLLLFVLLDWFVPILSSRMTGVGRSSATMRKSDLMFYPFLALTSINCTLYSAALLAASSLLTCRCYDGTSFLFPHNIITTSSPRSARTSSIHLNVWINDGREATS